MKTIISMAAGIATFVLTIVYIGVPVIDWLAEPLEGLENAVRIFAWWLFLPAFIFFSVAIGLAAYGIVNTLCDEKIS